MILDHIANIAASAKSSSAGMEVACRALLERDWAKESPGCYELVAGKLYVNVDESTGRGPERAVLEAHRLFIDIQLTLDGCEQIGWRDIKSCRRPRAPYDPVKDIVFFDERPLTWMAVPRDYFAIFWPSDAHAPLGGIGLVRKAVAKVAVDWP